MVAQLVTILALFAFLAFGGVFFLLYKALQSLRAISEQAILSSKAVSARDLAEAKEYSADAALSRDLTREQAGPAIATIEPQAPTYKDPITGTELKVLRPFL